MAGSPPERAIDQVVHDDLEPGVINEKMIKDTILAEYKGELGRMKTMERIELDKITVLRLEFLSSDIELFIWSVGIILKLHFHLQKF